MAVWHLKAAHGVAMNPDFVLHLLFQSHIRRRGSEDCSSRCSCVPLIDSPFVLSYKHVG